MKLLNLLKPKWQQGDAHQRLDAVSKLTCFKTLRKIADHCEDERLRFEAARRLDDSEVINELARSASLETVRLDASIFADEQNSLGTIALNAWDIEVGQKAVSHIENELMLHRVARSSKQDAIRLSAALKLGDRELLRRVAKSSNHIDVHWQVAKNLDDPALLAEVILFKPANMYLEPLRRKARRALTKHLNRCQSDHNHQGLVEALKAVPHPSFKLEAFNRLDPERISHGVLEYLADQDFRYIPDHLLEQMIDQIKRGGWQVTFAIQDTSCAYCMGKGQLSLKYLSSNDTWEDHDKFSCPDCDGDGKTPVRLITCSREKQTIRFPLPAKTNQEPHPS